MKKFLSCNAGSITLFSVIFSVISFFTTFDMYCKNQVTPETPLLNIAGLAFLRMDFVLIIFSAAFIIGALLSSILKKYVKFLLPLSIGAFGCMALFIALFDVNTMQILAPTMRISHVIMTVSRVLAIVLSVSGICVGISVAVLLNENISKKTVLIACFCAALAGIIANAQNLQTALYFVCAMLLMISSLVADFSHSLPAMPPKIRFTKNTIFNCISVMAFTVVFGISYSILCENAGFSEIGFTAVSGLILSAMILLTGKKQSAVLIGFGLFIGSVISYVLVHFASQVITYSGNRVIYVLPYSIGIVCIAVCVLFTAVSGNNTVKNSLIK